MMKRSLAPGSPSRREVLKMMAAGAAAPAAWSAGIPTFPELDVDLGTARVRARDQELIVETGIIERRWRLTAYGLATTALNNSQTGKRWAASAMQPCDWSLAGFGAEGVPARLVGLTARAVRFDPYMSDHVEAVAEFEYPNLRLRFTACAYPDAPGIRTQLSVSGAAREARVSKPAAVDSLPINCSRLLRRAAGYYNDTQHRNSREMEILREEVRQSPQTADETFDWASLLAVEDGGEGVCVVKESHKCVNQRGVDTGTFECGASRLATTGWGIGPADLQPDRFQEAWATWTLAFEGGDDGRELAVKVFDRCRFPVDPARDIYIMANTWGSAKAKQDAQNAAREENVLRQIEACRVLGIDVLQIDDGWQGNGYEQWSPAPPRYPHGWGTVREAARRAGVELGLWSSWVIGEKDLIRNYDLGGFRYFKIDFEALNTYAKVAGLTGKLKALLEHSGQTARINWDVTENAPRAGYYFARELGTVYLENRKQETPPQAVYVPSLVLRDAWQVAKYVNLNRFQLTIQNVDVVNRSVSNAFRYNHPYSVAIALMGTPLFFEEVSLYSKEARDLIRPLVALYKQHRRAMFDGYVFPIGDKPSDGSWTGFQNHNPAAMSGYMIVFRELNAAGAAEAIPLKFMAGRKIRMTNLREGSTRLLTIPTDGRVEFAIGRAPDFGFYRYEISPA